MKAFIAILLVTVFAYALSAADVAGRLSSSGDIGRGDREFITIYEEFFEDGAEDWEHYSVSGEYLWHIYEDSEAPSGSHAMGCFDDSSATYLPEMDDYIMSQEIFLPQDGTFFWNVYCQTYLDAGTLPDTDYFLVEVNSQIPNEEWTGWNSISNPLGLPGVDNNVFTGNYDTWTPFTEGWGMEYGDISVLEGRSVKFRFGLHSNLTDEPVPGGFRIDDFSVIQEVYLGPAPQNLVAQFNYYNQVELSWDAVHEGGEEGWIQWDDGMNNDAVGLTNGGEFYAAISFDQSDLLAYVGGTFTELEVYIEDAPASMNVFLWSGHMAANELLCQEYVPYAGSWNTITLDTLIEIESRTEYWIGYSVDHEQGQYPAGHDIGPAFHEKGDWAAIAPGQWESISGFWGFNWNIHAYVDADGRRLPVFSGAARDREVTGYNIYRSTESGGDYEYIGTIGQMENPFYLDEDPVQGNFNYYTVTALYEGIEGAMSDEAFAWGQSPDEIAYDDGTCEEGMNVGIARYMAVRFEGEHPLSLYLSFACVYIDSLNSGTLALRILEDDGGMPGNCVFELAVDADELHSGWNYIWIPPVQEVHFREGSFFVSIYEMQNLSAIGKDTDNTGSSWITTEPGDLDWQELNDGNIMIRAIVYYAPGAEPVKIMPYTMDLNAYPNPFNPETTIRFFTTEGTENTELSIYNVKGQKVRTLVDEILPEGEHSVIWNGRDGQNGHYVSSGVYFVKLKVGSELLTDKVMLVK